MDENLEREGRRHHRGGVGADIAKRDFDILPLDGQDLTAIAAIIRTRNIQAPDSNYYL